MITKEKTLEYKRTIKYQLQQNPKGLRWTAVTYPGEEKEVRQMYTDFTQDCCGTKFRIVKIETIRSVVQD